MGLLKMYIEIGFKEVSVLKNLFPMTYFKEHVKIVKMCMVKFNVKVLNRSEMMRFS